MVQILATHDTQVGANSSAAMVQNKQYSLWRILALWLAATLPMALVTWVLSPALVTRIRQPPILVYWILVILAMLWQFALSFWLVYHEEGDLRWTTLRQRTWLNRPRDPQTGQPRLRLFAWLLPFVLIAGLALGTGVLIGSFAPMLLRLVSPSANLSFLSSLSYLSVLDWTSPEFAGEWWLLGIAFLAWLLSSFLAEEFFFRGILLPKMAGAFGKRDWLANGILFGLYHLDKPWTIPFRLIESFAIVTPTRYFCSNWMAVSIRAVEGLFLFVVVLLGVTTSLPPPLPPALNLPHIETRPYSQIWRGGRLSSLPSFYPSRSTEAMQVDLRSYDLTRLNLRNDADELALADFDTRTQWPSSDQMPPGFNPGQILELGKNPGLGVRSLHARGITGRGVGIGIIDQPLLTEHQEYADQLRWYEELNSYGRSVAQMHGPAVASIAVGKNVGVAPEADLYYVATVNATTYNQYAYYAQGIRRILEINEALPIGRKIRVISMSLGWDAKRPGYNDITAAVREAETKGILCIYTSILQEEGRGYHGLGRLPLADPDNFTSYEPGMFWAPVFYTGQWFTRPLVYAPMDARTTAGPGGSDEYVFYRTGGLSWATPYLAGVYALAVQVSPKLTPDRFWTLAVETGRSVEIPFERRLLALNAIIDPSALIAALQ